RSFSPRPNPRSPATIVPVRPVQLGDAARIYGHPPTPASHSVHESFQRWLAERHSFQGRFFTRIHPPNTSRRFCMSSHASGHPSPATRRQRATLAAGVITALATSSLLVTPVAHAAEESTLTAFDAVDQFIGT